MTNRVLMWAMSALAAVPSVSRAVGAQSPVAPIGARVRITPAAGFGSPVVGKLIAQRSDTLIVQTGLGEQAVSALPLDRVAALQLSQSRHGHAGKGTEIGGLLGLAFGVVTGLTVNASSDERPGVVGMFGLGMAMMGSAAGAVVGMCVITDTWAPITTPPGAAPRIPMASNGRARVGFAIAF